MITRIQNCSIQQQPASWTCHLCSCFAGHTHMHIVQYVLGSTTVSVSEQLGRTMTKPGFVFWGRDAEANKPARWWNSSH